FGDGGRGAPLRKALAVKACKLQTRLRIAFGVSRAEKIANLLRAAIQLAVDARPGGDFAIAHQHRQFHLRACTEPPSAASRQYRPAASLCGAGRPAPSVSILASLACERVSPASAARACHLTASPASDMWPMRYISPRKNMASDDPREAASSSNS